MLAIFAVVMTGCEDSPDTDNNDDYFEDSAVSRDPRDIGITPTLTVAPASATATFIGQAISFTVSGGSGGFKWSVANSAGSVRVEGSSMAVYTVGTLSGNSVIVYDSAGHAGVATITGPNDPSLSAAADPISLSSDGSKSILTATGGTPPYSWSVTDLALGTLNSGSGQQVVYTRGHVGDNSVTVSDSTGASYHVILQQP